MVGAVPVAHDSWGNPRAPDAPSDRGYQTFPAPGE
jgi:hypothetical protein